MARLMVPLVVMGPPVRPAPVLIPVTVPMQLLVLVIVTAPAELEREMPAPAVKAVTPVLLTVTFPVFPLTLMPDPAKMPVTAPPPPPEEVM
jgi:hypothetical protein